MHGPSPRAKNAVTVVATTVPTAQKNALAAAAMTPFLATIKTIQNAINMTVSEVKGSGRQKAHKEIYRGTEFSVDYPPEIKIELFVPDSRVELAVAAMLKGAKTAELGDRNVYGSQIEDARAFPRNLSRRRRCEPLRP